MKRLLISALLLTLAGQVDAEPHPNHLARYLAAMPLSKSNSLKHLARSRTYLYYKVRFKRFWNYVERYHVNRISKWREEHVSAQATQQTAFYPLSGADFLNFYGLYRNASTYVMVALEDPGPLPDPNTWSAKKHSKYLNNVLGGMHTIADKNYFYSYRMKKNLVEGKAGLLPVLLIFMSRMGLQIDKLENIYINEQGRLIKLAGRTAKSQGLRISFHNANGDSKWLIYLQMRLGDESADINTKEGKFFHSLGRTDTMMKSAVYLFHFDRYPRYRNFLLGISETFIQDDSGIPFKHFDDRWQINLFGRYNKPYPISSIKPHVPRQLDLIKAYKKKSSKINFQFGYGTLWGWNKSNLQLFIRKKPKYPKTDTSQP